MTQFYEDPVYVKMCEKAVEIQSLRNNGDCYTFSKFDIYRYTDPRTVVRTSVAAYEMIWSIADYEPIWLPRQDQLQRMIPILEYTFSDDETSENRYNIWYDGHNFFGSSWEQCLIQTVMSELHNKKWDGEDWV